MQRNERLAINLLFKINTALKLTFNADEPSLYPFIEFEPDVLRLDPLKISLLVPPNLEKMELGRLRNLYDNDRGSMTAEEIERYFDLLCKVEGDCELTLVSLFRDDSKIDVGGVNDEALLENIKAWQNDGGDYTGVDEWTIVELPKALCLKEHKFQ